MSPWLLALLVLFDAALTGFRSGAGRNPRIFLYHFYRRCVARGLVLGLAVALAFALVGLAMGYWGGPTVWSDLLSAGDRMVAACTPFAKFGPLALSLYGLNMTETTILATMLLLGPMTFVRPLVIVGASLCAAAGAQFVCTAAMAVAAGAVMLGFESLLEFGRPPWSRTELPPLVDDGVAPTAAF